MLGSSRHLAEKQRKERKKSLEQFATLEEIRCGEPAQTEKMREDMATIDALVRAQLCLLRGWKVDEEGAKAMEVRARSTRSRGGGGSALASPDITRGLVCRSTPRRWGETSIVLRIKLMEAPCRRWKPQRSAR